MNVKHGLMIAFALMSISAITGCNSGGSGGGGGGTVAVVNGEAISEDEYFTYMESKGSMIVDPKGVGNTAILQQALQTMANGGEVNMPLPNGQTPGLQSLRDLVTRALTVQMAKAEGYEATKEKVDAEIAFQKKLRDSFVKDLQNYKGMAMAQIRRQVGFELAQQAVITKGITVSDKDVDDFIAANKQQFVDPAEADLLWIVVSTDDQKSKVDQELAKGTRFKDVALQMSEDEAKDTRQAAYPGSKIVPAMPKQLQDLVGKTDVNKATEWIKDSNKWIKLYVVSKKAEKEQPITPERKESVRRTLALDRGRQGKDMNERILESLVNAEIEIKREGLKVMWDSYMSKAKEALKDVKGSSTGGNTTPAN